MAGAGVLLRTVLLLPLLARCCQHALLPF